MFEKRVIHKSDIFKRLDSLDVFKNYCPDFKLGQDISSPFRKDTNPSFGITLGKRGEYIFKDLGTGEHGDCLDLVQRLYNLSYFNTLSKIATDFQFPTDEDFFYKNMDHVKTTVKEMTDEELKALHSISKKTELKVRTREWIQKDAQYWFQFGVSYQALMYYNVKPITHIFINDQIIKSDEIAYVFVEFKDDKETYKVYQPYNKQGLKWLSSHDNSVWQGWTQLPEKGDTLIITKSLKDVMSIASTLRIPTVAMQSENTKPKEQIIENLQSRFEDIYVFYDNDFDKEENLGRMLSKSLLQQLGGGYQIEIPDEFKSKDYSDTVVMHGVEQAKQIVRSQLIPF